MSSHGVARPPLTTHHSPLTTHHSPLTTHHSPLTTHHSPLTTHHSPLTTHHSPLTTHHSPLTTHHSLHPMSIVSTLINAIEFNRTRTLGLLDNICKESDPQRILGWRPGPGRAHIAWQLTHVGV